MAKTSALNLTVAKPIPTRSEVQAALAQIPDRLRRADQQLGKDVEKLKSSRHLWESELEPDGADS